MSHEITQRKDGSHEMAFVEGTDRWHGLGNELKPGASIDEWVKAARMDWEVQRSPVYFGDQEAGWSEEFGDKHVLFRSDNHQPLGVVSRNYKIVQPGQVLEFFRDLCEFNKFKMRTAGTLFGGRIYWALADIGEEANVRPEDKVKGRLLLSTSADGTKATVAKFVAECVVCNNTLTMAMQEKGGSRSSTSHRSEFDASKVKTDLGIGHEQFALFMDTAKTLATIKVTEEQAVEFFSTLLNTKGGVDRGEKVETSAPFKNMLGLYQGEGLGATLAGRKGTAWGLVNAVTEYIDHRRRAALPDNRLNNTWFGFGERFKMAAFQMAQDTLLPKKRGKK